MITYYILAVLAVCSASVSSQYLLAEYAPKHDNYKPANYHFSYGVSDPSTGDHKHHWEKRQGDHVVGEYGLLEPDGATRIVQYTADPHNGFQAIVKRIESQHQITPDQYTQGHALYGGQYHGLYHAQQLQLAHPQQQLIVQPHNEGQVQIVQSSHGYPSGQQLVEAYPQQHGESEVNALPAQQILDVEHREIPQQPNEEPGNQYFLNQYAGHFQINVPDEESRDTESIQHNQEINGQGPVQQAPIEQNVYSTIQLQPNYPETKVEHPQNVYQQDRSLPQFVIDNIQNQYNGGNKNVELSVVQEPRGFSHEHQIPTNNNVEQSHVAQHLPQEISQQQQEQELKAISQNQQQIQYVTQQTPTHFVEHTTAAPQLDINNGQAVTNNYDQLGHQGSYRFENVQPDVQVIPNGENTHHVITQPQEAVQVSTEKTVQLNPLLTNLMQYIRNHMPQRYREEFKSYIQTPLGNVSPQFRQEIVSSTTAAPIEDIQSQNNAQIYIQTPVGNVSPRFQQEIVSSTTAAPIEDIQIQNKAQIYPNNPYLNGELQLAQGNQKSSVEDYAQNPYLNGEIQLNNAPIKYNPNTIINTDDRKDYTYNPYLHGEGPGQYANQGQSAQGYGQNDQPKNIYYEIDPAAYQQNVQNQEDRNTQQQGASGTIFQTVNENGYNLRTPNLFQPTDPNLYNQHIVRVAVDPNQGYQNPEGDYSQTEYRLQKSLQTHDNLPSAATDGDFIWNAGDPTAPRDPEILVRQLNATCLHFRFNQTNDYTERDQDPHIWNSGDYTALRPEEEYIRSINVTCDNFTNDALTNFTSGFSLWQYCSQCLNRVDEDATVVNKQVIIGQNGQPIEVFYPANQPNNQENYNQYNPQINVPLPSPDYQDGRSNGEIAGIVKVYNPNYVPKIAPAPELTGVYNQNDGHPVEIKLNGNLAALLNQFNAQANLHHGQPQIYVNNEQYNQARPQNPQIIYSNEGYAQEGNNIYKRNIKSEDTKKTA